MIKVASRIGLEARNILAVAVRPWADTVVLPENRKNPQIPKWLEEDYFRAIRSLAELGPVEVLQTENPEEIRAILSILAMSSGARTHVRLLVDSPILVSFL
jgi:hypothetical protein